MSFTPIRRSSARCRGRRAFTLIEVMIAGGILFMCLFVILALLSNTLNNARNLQHQRVDAGMLAAQLSLTNRLNEGSESGDFSDFGDMYPDYRWERKITEVDTNGLFEVDFTVERRSGDHPVTSHMSILLFRPDSPRFGGFPR